MMNTLLMYMVAAGALMALNYSTHPGLEYESSTK